MYIGSVLLQPQRLKRTAVTDTSQALVEDMISLATRVIVDKAMGGHIVQTMEDAFEELTLKLVAQIGNDLGKIQGDLKKLFSPIIDFFPGVMETLSKDPDPAKIIESILEIVSFIGSGLASLTLDELRTVVKTILDIFQKDLGINGRFIQDRIWGLIEDLIARLEALPTEINKAVRDNRINVITTLRRLKRHLKDKFVFPELDPDEIATLLAEALRKLGVEKASSKIACVGEGVKAGAKVGTSLFELVPYTGFGGRSLGAGEADSPAKLKYLWYPSWVAYFDGNGVFDQSGTDVYVDFEKERIMKAKDRTEIETATDWKEMNVFSDRVRPHYSFKLSKDGMEFGTQYATAAADVVEMFLGLASIRKGNELRGGLSLFIDLGHAIFKFVGSPFSFWLLTDKFGIKNNMFSKRIADVPVILSVLIGSFQGLHTNASAGNGFKHWLFGLLFSGILARVGNNALPQAGLKFLISLVTLINSGDPDNPSETPVTVPPKDQDPNEPVDLRPINRREVNGIVDLFGTASGYILTKIVPRENYIHPFYSGDTPISAGEQAVKLWLTYNLACGLGLGVLGSLVGTLIAFIPARQFDLKVLRNTIFYQTLKLMGLFWILLYSFRENDTDDGKYNPRGPEFDGYPDPSNSPYMFPWEDGNAWLCVQGNQGIITHNNFGDTPQVYAYDFAMDQDTPILAARGGTVVDYFDWIANDEHPDAPGSGDNPADSKFDVWRNARDEAAASKFLVSGQTSSPTWNFIVIRHDAANKDHDKDQGGMATTTYAVYGHGRKDSVRKSFGDRGVAPAKIIGTAVTQGQQIMLTGNTGNSMMNHLHLMVQPGPAASTKPPITNLTARTIPFVFKTEVGDDASEGVPKSMTFYTSTTKKV